jgi:hypothetical protein
MYVCMYVCMYVRGGQDSSASCTATAKICCAIWYEAIRNVLYLLYKLHVERTN